MFPLPTYTFVLLQIRHFCLMKSHCFTSNSTLLAGSTIFFVNFCHYFPVIMEVSVENTPHRFMAQAK